MKINGGCHCRNITYEAGIDPGEVLICHCTDCQVMSGTAFRTVVFVPVEQFTLLTGELKKYVKIADSGNRRAMMFCPECGTQIYATTADQGPGVLGLRVGTAEQRSQLRPVKQHYCHSSLDWIESLQSVERIENA